MKSQHPTLSNFPFCHDQTTDPFFFCRKPIVGTGVPIKERLAVYGAPVVLNTPHAPFEAPKPRVWTSHRCHNNVRDATPPQLAPCHASARCLISGKCTAPSLLRGGQSLALLRAHKAPQYAPLALQYLPRHGSEGSMRVCPSKFELHLKTR